MRIELTVNGALRRADVPPMTTLAAVLREELGLLGTKVGCGEGECGACSVIMDGRLVNSCLVPAVQASGAEILTIEGLGTSENMDLMQKAFVSEGAIQCGFCTPGMILAARALLEEEPMPSADRIKEALSGNICRCTGYERIYNAVNKAVSDGYCATFKKRENLCSDDLPQPTRESEKSCFTPETLNEALAVLAEHSDAEVMAGTTDIYPDIKNGKFTAKTLLDLSRVKELKGIYKSGGEIHIGACANNGDLIRSYLIEQYLPALHEAARRSGAPAVQNRATIGGNVATASGAADLPSILLPLEARIQLDSTEGTREMPLEKFINGYRKTERRPNELITEIIIPVPKPGTIQKFCKRGSRKALTLSRISLGFCMLLDEDGYVVKFTAGAGSMSPVPIRLPKTEAFMFGKHLDEDLIDEACRTMHDEVNPRKSAAWRKKMASNLLRTFLLDAMAKPMQAEEPAENEPLP